MFYGPNQRGEGYLWEKKVVATVRKIPSRILFIEGGRIRYREGFRA